jgi:hypothetical protein
MHATPASWSPASVGRPTGRCATPPVTKQPWPWRSRLAEDLPSPGRRHPLCARRTPVGAESHVVSECNHNPGTPERDDPYGRHLGPAGALTASACLCRGCRSRRCDCPRPNPLDDLQARLAVAHLAEQRPAPTPTSLLRWTSRGTMARPCRASPSVCGKVVLDRNCVLRDRGLHLCGARNEWPATGRQKSLPVAPPLDDSRKRYRRLSNSHCIAGATELSPSMPSLARSPRLLRPGAWDLDVATAWLAKCWTATLRKRKGRPRRPPSLTAADRGKRPLSGLAFVRLMRRAGATASRVHLTPRAAGAPSAPTEAPPWPLPTDALGHRRSPAWPRS